MARETAEIPAVAERLLARTGIFAAIVERIEQVKPRVVVFCCRGSSGHVGVYLRYLFEARLGLLDPFGDRSEHIGPREKALGRRRNLRDLAGHRACGRRFSHPCPWTR